jgi:hypothetical protein
MGRMYVCCPRNHSHRQLNGPCLECTSRSKLRCCNPSFGLATKATGLEGGGPRRRPGSHFTCSRECKRVWGNEPSHSQVNSHVESWSPKRTFESSECDYRGQNPLSQRVLYIIENLLKRRYLKWACIAHLDIWNTSYGQKKGWESKWRFHSRPLKVRNQPNFLACRWNATYRWKKLLTKATTLFQTSLQLEVYTRSYAPSKSRES